MDCCIKFTFSAILINTKHLAFLPIPYSPPLHLRSYSFDDFASIYYAHILALLRETLDQECYILTPIGLTKQCYNATTIVFFVHNKGAFGLLSGINKSGVNMLELVNL